MAIAKLEEYFGVPDSSNYTGSCPNGYSPKSGDVPGWGSISSNHRKTTVNDCSALCDTNTSCCSFEYSKTVGYALLNRTLPNQNLLYRNLLNRTLLNHTLLNRNLLNQFQESAKPHSAKPESAKTHLGIC